MPTAASPCMSDPSASLPPTAPRLTGTWPTHVAPYETGDPGEGSFSMEVFHATSAARGYRAAETQGRSVSEETTERVKAAATARLADAMQRRYSCVTLFGIGTATWHR